MEEEKGGFGGWLYRNKNRKGLGMILNTRN